MELPADLLDLLRRPSPCFLATINADGSPQLTQTWVDTDGEHVVINTVPTHRKVANMRRDPRVAVNIADPEQPARYYSVRGEVVAMTEDGAREHIDELARRYLGVPYPGFGESAAAGRLIVRIAVHRAGLGGGR